MVYSLSTVHGLTIDLKSLGIANCSPLEGDRSQSGTHTRSLTKRIAILGSSTREHCSENGDFAAAITTFTVSQGAGESK